MDDDAVIFRRVEYDFNKTIEKVKRLDGLSDVCGLRLAAGYWIPDGFTRDKLVQVSEVGQQRGQDIFHSTLPGM